MEIKITKLKCLRCGHSWFPRAEKLPAVCGKCKSKYWQTKVRFPTISKAQKLRHRKKIKHAKGLDVF